MKRNLWAMLVALMTVAGPALAGREIITDAVYDPSDSTSVDTFPNDGHRVDAEYSLNAGDSVDLDYLNFGMGQVRRTVTLGTNGQLNFTSGSSPTTDSFAPFLTSKANFSSANISFRVGIIDPSDIDSSLTADFSSESTPPALIFDQFLFRNVQVDGVVSPFTFDALFVQLDANDFLLSFDYSIFNPAAPSGATAEYSIGANSMSFAVPDPSTVKNSDDTFGVDFCFHNGVESAFSKINACQNSAATLPITVPEPDSLALLGLGSLLLAFSIATRRAS